MGAECPLVLGSLEVAAACAASCCALLAGTIFTATFCPAAPSASCTGASAPWKSTVSAGLLLHNPIVSSAVVVTCNAKQAGGAARFNIFEKEPQAETW